MEIMFHWNHAEGKRMSEKEGRKGNGVKRSSRITFGHDPMILRSV